MKEYFKMMSDLLAEHLKNVASDHGYKSIDSITEEEDRYVLTTSKAKELVIFKDNIHTLVEA